MSALLWLWEKGYRPAVPLGHSPDYDLLAEIGFRAVRVQVKTSTVFRKGAGSSLFAPAVGTKAGMGW
jgi:hypothetical protein